MFVCSRSNCNLKVLVFEERGKPEWSEKNRLGARERTNNKFNPLMASTPGFEPGPHWWEPSALTTAPPLLLISSRLVNWEERYSGTRDVRHLKAMIAFLKYNWVATGSHLRSFKTGVMWSYVRILVAIRAAKFWIRLNLLWTKICIKFDHVQICANWEINLFKSG